MRKRPTIAIALPPIVLFLLLPVATNVATTGIPEGLAPYLWLAWPIALLLATPVVVSEVRNRRLRTLWGGAAAGGGPAPEAEGVTPRNLPRDIPDFTGRGQHVDMIARHIGASVMSPTVTIAAIHGMPGVGKTSLAVHVGHRIQGRFPDGQLFIDLRGFAPGVVAAEPTDALESLLHQLGVPAGKIPPTLDERVSHFRTRIAGRRLLILLDNAKSEHQVRQLLPGSPGTAVIVTSRSRLGGLEGAQQISLETMRDNEAIALLTKIVGTGRLADRTTQASEIAGLCGHLPLAIRLAGARMASRPNWSASTLADRLRSQRRRIEQLRAGDMSVVAAFAVSYENLDLRGRLVFRALGLSTGGDIDVTAVAALAGIDATEAAESLDELVDGHLVDESPDARYRMHDLLRQHARDVAVRIDPPELRRQAQIRMLTHYLAKASKACATLDPTCRRIEIPGSPSEPDQASISYAEALRWFEVERSNLVAAISLAVEMRADEYVWRLALALHPYFLLRGGMDDWVSTKKLAVDAARRLDDAVAEADALLSLGIASRRLGRCQDGVKYQLLALERYRSVDDKVGEMNSLVNLGIVYRRLGRYRDAVEVQEAAIELHEALRDQVGEASALTNLGLVYQRLGQYPESLACHQKAYEMARRIKEHHCVAMAATNIGIVYERMSRLDEAFAQHELALGIAQEIGDQHVEGHTLNNLGVVLSRSGKHDDAIKYHRSGLELLRQTGSRGDECEALNDIGYALYGRGDYRGAKTNFDDALKMAQQIGDRYLEARALYGRALVLRRKDRSGASRSYREAIAIFSELGVPEAAELREPSFELH
ncbi:ATP-binding protein [Phytohabitans sp. LJ34]|uniref:ATP-binding protein n=1 Tax=Phytohabitans sp. LJ34 TaxID=3452217 RepID=UPI003F8C4B9C